MIAEAPPQPRLVALASELHGTLIRPDRKAIRETKAQIRDRWRNWRLERGVLVPAEDAVSDDQVFAEAAARGLISTVRYDLGLLGNRVVTDAGVAFMADDFFDASTDITTFDFHDMGTGTTAAAVGDTVLQTPWGGARVSGTATNPTAPVYRTVATIPFTGTFAITEHGLFSASTGGTLWDRTVFAAINVVNGDSIQNQYDLTCTSGG